MKIVSQSIQRLVSTSSPLEVIEAAGRTCYKSESRITPDSAEKFVRAIIKSGHESVLEHASVSFRIITDRGVSHELVRHRMASYSQESTRYCNYGKKSGEITVIEPPDLSSLKREMWIMSCGVSEAAYLSMVESGCTPQIARSVLPTCLKTELVMTANFREWRHFLKLRTAKAAHPQMRQLASMILDWFRTNCPVVVEDIKEEL